jgi:hypothetical protein
MAKKQENKGKNNTKNNIKPNEVLKQNTIDSVYEYEGVIEQSTFIPEGSDLLNTTPITQVKTLKDITIEELVAYERACSIVCGKYEVKARLSGVDNTKFMQFIDYHRMILNEMEERVAVICN